jgi:multifunctional beta-oxidation protein
VWQKSVKPVKVDQEILDKISEALKAEPKGTDFKYEERDVMLYNLGIGAKRTELPYVL